MSRYIVSVATPNGVRYLEKSREGFEMLAVAFLLSDHVDPLDFVTLTTNHKQAARFESAADSMLASCALDDLGPTRTESVEDSDATWTGMVQPCMSPSPARSTTGPY